MGPWTDSVVRQEPRWSFHFDSERSPVAVAVDAVRLLTCDALLARELDWLRGVGAVTSHLSIGLRGPADAREALADVLESELQEPMIAIHRAPPAIADVLPRCPLLVPERGDCRWSRVGLLVPPESAWLAADVRLPDFVAADGRVDRSALGACLDDLLAAMDACHDGARWPTPRMQQDAWINRRIAIRPTGIDALYRDFDYGPGELHQLTGWISARLQACSRRIAGTSRALPAIRETDPARDMPAGPQRDEWRRRWHLAVDATSVRHRNLLALSADALVVYDAEAGRPRYDLLRLLQHADVVAIGNIDEPGGNTSANACYRRHLVASLQQRHCLDQIAKHV